MLVLAAFGASGAWATEANYYNEGNNGFTEATAYVIDSVEDFDALRTRVNNGTEPEGRYYKLAKNLEVYGTIGEGESRPFTGHFDGDGNKFTQNSYSIFGYIDTDGVAVKNLYVSGGVHVVNNLVSGTVQGCYVESNISISGYPTYVDYCTGGIASVVSINGTIKECRFIGTITAHAYEASIKAYAGGIVGRLEGGTVENCEVRITDAIYAYSGQSGGSDVGNAFAGGIVGEATQRAIIRNNKAVGTIRSKQWAGGIAGYLGGSAEASGNAIVLDSRLSAVSRAVGGVVGQLNQAAVKDNRAYTTITGRASYKGKIIGEIVDSPNTITGNYYSVDGAEYTIGYDSTLRTGSNDGGTAHDPETAEQIEQNKPADETPSNGNGGTDNNNGSNNGTNNNDGTNNGTASGDVSGSSGGSSGGCNSGLGLLAMAFAAALVLKHRK